MTVLSRPSTLGLVPINNLPKHARKANYLYPDFPTFRVSTMNIRGYSSGTQNKEHKRLRTAIEPIELVDVLNELNVPRTSCPGPNGIPFIIYGRLSTIAAPLFLSLIHI